MLWVRLLVEEADDVVLEVLRLHFGKEGLDHATFLVDQELRKVPRHLAAPESVAGLEKLPDRVGSGTVDLDLAEHGESHAVLLCDLEKRKEKRKSQWRKEKRRSHWRDTYEGLDLALASGLLRGELVARKSQYRQAIVLTVQGLKACVLVGVASFRRHVHDEADLAAEGAQSEVFAVDIDC